MHGLSYFAIGGLTFEAIALACQGRWAWMAVALFFAALFTLTQTTPQGWGLN